MPESKDSDWDWSEFVALNNNQLVATWGNLANRMLSFSYKNWDGQVPEINQADLREPDLNLLATIEAGFDSVGKELNAIHLRAALSEAMRLSTEVNRYIDANAPWTSIKTSRSDAALTVYTALKAIDSLKILFAPILPFSSEKLHTTFGYDTPLFGAQYIQTVQDALGEHDVLRYKPVVYNDSLTGFWKPSELKPGQKLNPPVPLFKKLDVVVAQQEREKLGLITP
jgi:methionyl-tRNA synthetase